MRARLAQLIGVIVTLTGGTAWAQAALDETPPSSSEPPAGDVSTSGTSSEVVDPDKVVSYGVGIRLRNMWIPQGLIDMFVERSGGGASNLGFGVEAIRRRGNLELQLAFEF